MSVDLMSSRAWGSSTPARAARSADGRISCEPPIERSRVESRKSSFRGLGQPARRFLEVAGRLQSARKLRRGGEIAESRQAGQDLVVLKKAQGLAIHRSGRFNHKTSRNRRAPMTEALLQSAQRAGSRSSRLPGRLARAAFVGRGESIPDGLSGPGGSAGVPRAAAYPGLVAAQVMLDEQQAAQRPAPRRRPARRCGSTSGIRSNGLKHVEQREDHGADQLQSEPVDIGLPSSP